MPKVRLSLSVSDSHLDKMGEVSKAAKKAGLRVEENLGDLGILVGSIDKAKVGQLNRIAGVSHVEEERTVGIAPPGSPIQ